MVSVFTFFVTFWEKKEITDKKKLRYSVNHFTPLLILPLLFFYLFSLLFQLFILVFPSFVIRFLYSLCYCKFFVLFSSFLIHAVAFSLSVPCCNRVTPLSAVLNAQVRFTVLNSSFDRAALLYSIFPLDDMIKAR